MGMYNRSNNTRKHDQVLGFAASYASTDAHSQISLRRGFAVRALNVPASKEDTVNVSRAFSKVNILCTTCA